MRTVSPEFLALANAAQRKISGRALFRDPRLLFTAEDFSDTEAVDSIYDHDSTVYSGSGVLRVLRNDADKLCFTYWTDPLTAYPDAFSEQGGLTLSGSSGIGVEGGRAWFLNDSLMVCYADWDGSDFGTPVEVLDADAEFGTHVVSFAPVSDDTCYLQVGPVLSGSSASLYHSELYQIALSGSSYELGEFHGFVYGDPSARLRFDAVRLGDVDYVFVGDRDDGRALFCSVQEGVWSELKQVMALDVVDETSNFSLGGAEVIDGKIFVTGVLKRSRSTSEATPDNMIEMVIYLMGDGKRFSMSRDLFITNDLTQDVAGKMLLLGSKIYYMGYGGKAWADATTLVGYDDNASRETDTDMVYAVDVSLGVNQASQLSMDVSPNLVSANVRRAAELEVYAELTSGSVSQECLIGTFGIDVISEGSDESGQTRQVGARGLGLRKVDQWSSDQSYDYWSQTRSLIPTPEDLKDLVHVSGTWISGSSVWTGGSTAGLALMEDDLNVEAYMYSVEKAVRGGEMRAKFVCPDPDGLGYFTPRYGVGMCYYRESRYEAATRLGIDSESVTESQYGNYGLFAIIEGGYAQLYQLVESIEYPIGGSAAIGVDPEDYHWVQLLFQDGYYRVCVRDDVSTDWAEILSGRFDADEEPWFRDDIGRGAIYVNNVTPHSLTPGFSSEQDIVPVYDADVFPEVGRVIVDDEQISYEGKATAASVPATMIATTGQAWTGAPHDNAYWLDGVIKTVPYAPGDIHIGDLEYDMTAQYLAIAVRGPHGLDRIDAVRLKVWKEARLPNAAYIMQPAAGKIWRSDDITVGSPTWTELTIPPGSYEGTLVSFSLYPGSMTQAYVVTQLTVGASATNGPRVYKVTGLLGATLSFTEIWGDAENQAYVGGNYQRANPAFFWSIALGRFIGIVMPSIIGAATAFVSGDEGAWSGGQISGWTHGTPDGAACNVVSVSGGVILGAGGEAMRSADEGATWAVKWSYGHGADNLITDGTNVIWQANWDDVNTWVLYHHSGGMNPPSALYGSAVDIRPTDNGHKYHPARGGPWHGARALLATQDMIYMLGESQDSSADFKWFSKASWSQTEEDFAMVYDFGAWRLRGIDVHTSNSLKIIGKTQLASNNGSIVYSEDGGATWADKTGDWAGNKQLDAQVRFAAGSAVVT